MNRVIKAAGIASLLGALVALGGCVYPYQRTGAVYSDGSQGQVDGNAAVDAYDSDYYYPGYAIYPSYYAPDWYGYGYGWPAIGFGFYGSYWGGGHYYGGYHHGAWGYGYPHAAPSHGGIYHGSSVPIPHSSNSHH